MCEEKEYPKVVINIVRGYDTVLGLNIPIEEIDKDLIMNEINRILPKNIDFVKKVSDQKKKRLEKKEKKRLEKENEAASKQ